MLHGLALTAFGSWISFSMTLHMLQACEDAENVNTYVDVVYVNTCVHTVSVNINFETYCPSVFGRRWHSYSRI